MEEALGKAQALEKQYNWLEARNQYEQALQTVDAKDFLKKAELHEKIGFCLHRAAFQAESQEEFKERIGRAIDAYEQARGLYGNSDSEERSARISRCRAWTKYLGYWVERRPGEKLRLLEQCLELEAKALTAFWDLGDKLEYGRTYNQFPLVFSATALLERDLQGLRKILDDGIRWGEKAVEALSELGEPDDEAKAHMVLASCLLSVTSRYEDVQEQLRISSETKKHLSEAFELSQGSEDSHLLGLLHYRWTVSGVESGPQDALMHCEKILKYGEETRDSFLKGLGLNGLSHHIVRRLSAIEDADEAVKLVEEAKELHDRAEVLYSIHSSYAFSYVFLHPFWGDVRYYFLRGQYETDPQRKRDFYRKSVEVGTKVLEEAEELEIGFTTLLLHLSQSLEAQAHMEPDPDSRKKMLEKALQHIERARERGARMAPFISWGAYVYNCQAGMIKADLADTEQDLKIRSRILEDAASMLERGLESVYRQPRDPWQRTNIGSREVAYARVMAGIHVLTKRPENLVKAVEALSRAVEHYNVSGLESRIAECYWEMANFEDLLGEHLKASERFEQASDSYTRAAEKIPQLGDFYKDHARYMQAWGEIAKARHLHGERDYEGAVEHYEKAGELHEATARWSHLSSNYMAWAKLEQAEALSRREEPEKARDAFEQVADLFTQARHDMSSRPAATRAGAEGESGSPYNLPAKGPRTEFHAKTQELAEFSDRRRQYCLGRAVLEDARVSAGQGASAVSARKYGMAASQFEKLMEDLEQEAERRELRPIAGLCHAWAKMMQAEDMASPTLYEEASVLFEQVVRDAVDSQTSLLAKANGYMCRALGAGTRFEATKDPEQFSTAKKLLEAATTQYLRAGYRNTSEYSRATSRLLDAYFYMYQAQVEVDPARRSQSYQMAETMLQTSAGSYVKARLPAKAEELQRMLEIVREDREIAVSLSEVLKAPTIASTTAGFLAPSQSRETAVGLERFDNADIQANLMPRDQEAKLGDTIRLKMDLVNAGRGGAQLIKVAELLPQGFEVIQKPEMYLVEDHGLNLKGKSLAPLRTEELSLVLKPLDKGTYQIRPRILYLDESGKYKSHEPEPATIVVKELGISGWLKGPTRDK